MGRRPAFHPIDSRGFSGCPEPCADATGHPKFRRDQPPETDVLPPPGPAGRQRQRCRAWRSALVRHSRPRVRPIVIAARITARPLLASRSVMKSTQQVAVKRHRLPRSTSGSRPRRGQEPGSFREQLSTWAEAPRRNGGWNAALTLPPEPITLVIPNPCGRSAGGPDVNARPGGTCRPRCAVTARFGDGPLGSTPVGWIRHRGRSVGLKPSSRLRSAVAVRIQPGRSRSRSPPASRGRESGQPCQG